VPPISASRGLNAFLFKFSCEGPAEVERLASKLIELSTHQHFVYWRASGLIFQGWGRSASGDPAQGLAEACKRLIKNCIICWNYLYLSQKLAEIDDPAKREELLQAMAHGSGGRLGASESLGRA
jgi:hypothetical protein